MKTSSLVKNLLLLTVSLCLAFLLGELIMRQRYKSVISAWNFKNVQLIAFPNRADNEEETYRAVMKYSERVGADTSLYSIRPQKHLYGVERKEQRFLQAHCTGPIVQEVMKQWNYNFVKNTFLVDSLSYRKFHFETYTDGLLYAFQPYDSSEYPVYRYFSNAVASSPKFRFNKFGWTGSDIEFRKPDSIIRIAFLGGSTTQQYPDCDFSYPDYIGAWLNEWARRKNLKVRFEVINTGRVAQRSMDFESIFKYELQPVQPDVVVYYEGRNQFNTESALGFKQYRSFDRNLAYAIVGRSILLQSIINALGISYYSLFEWQKPHVGLKWPNGLDEHNPEINTANLPVSLNQISDNLSGIIRNMDTTNQTLLLCSYAMVCEDSVLKQKAFNYAYTYWLHELGRVEMKHISRLNNFENRYFKKFAEKNSVGFADVAEVLKKYPQLFDDGIHLSSEGMKLQAWVVYQQLLPIITQRIASGVWPHKKIVADTKHPHIKDDAFLVNLKKFNVN